MTIVDLSRLPPPDVVETISFDAILAERKERLISEYPAEQQAAVRRTLALESEPIVKLLRESAYREMVLRQRVNEAAKASLLAYAAGADLDHRAAEYGVERLQITPADFDAVPPVPAVWESDARLRYRAQMALEGLSVAGSRGAYLFHSLSASPHVADASVDSPRFEAVTVPDAVRAVLPADAIVLVCTHDAGLSAPLPGDISIAVLPTPTSPAPAAQLVDTVCAALSEDDVRPLTDRPRVQAGQPVPYRVTASLVLEHGPDADVVLAAARKQLDATISAARKLAGLVPHSAIYAALHVPGVRRVELVEPTQDIACDLRQYPECQAIQLIKGATA